LFGRPKSSTDAPPRVSAGLRYSPFAAVIASALFGLTQSTVKDFFAAFTVASMSFAAALAVGVVVGFLFGIPRRLQREELDPGVGSALLVNTNLEQISDWLTKIIVGVGLVEIGRLGHGLSSLADTIDLGGGTGAHAFALGLLVYALADGFFVSYLWTRIELSAQLVLADKLLLPIPAPPPPPLPPRPTPSPTPPVQPSPAGP
jgi:hypothetical protein